MEKGSSTFGTAIMNTEEYLLMAQTMKENGSPVKQIAADIELLDDLLQLQRVRVIGRAVMFTKSGRLRKDNTLQGMINNRLDRYIQDNK